MSMVVFGATIAGAIAVGTAGAYVLMAKFLTSKRGKKAVKSYAKEMTDLTYEILKENMADTKKWEELMQMSYDN